MDLEQIDEYTLGDEIGRGSMGVVCKATNPEGKQFALKTFLGDERTTEAEWRFLRDVIITEGRRMMPLVHQHIVRVYDVRQTEDFAYIVMEYIEGNCIDKIVEERGPLDPSMVLEWLRQAASALDYSYQRHGLIHRDVKPANMLLTTSMTDLKLMDFGIAKRAAGKGSTAGVSLFANSKPGTPNYRAPEQIHRKQEVTDRADQWGLAVTAFYMLTGTLPFEGEDVDELNQRICHDPAPLITSRRTSLPRGFNAVFQKALKKNPKDRFESCTEFATHLQTAASGGATDSKRVWLIGGGVAAAVAVMALLAFGFQGCVGVNCSGEQKPEKNRPQIKTPVDPVQARGMKNPDPASSSVAHPIAFADSGASRISPFSPDKQAGAPALDPLVPTPSCRPVYKLSMHIHVGTGKETVDVSRIPDRHWSLAHPLWGSLGRDDIYALVAASGCPVPPGDQLQLQWTKDGLPMGGPDVKASTAVGRAIPFSNMVLSGQYAATLSINGKEVDKYDFTIDK